MRTYYELEDYHWDMINEKGFIKGSIVWFADLHSHNEIIETGVVIGHDIHIEGDIELKVEITKEYKKYPDEIWDTSDKVDTYTYTKTVFMDDCFFNKEDAIVDGKTRLKSRIKTLGDRIKYERKKLKELENM